MNTVNDEKFETLLSKGQIPIIDLGHCGTEECPIKSVITRVGSQLHKALMEKGLALLVNHGISQDKLTIAWEYLDSFCELPTDIKEHYIRKGDDNHGYVQPGQEKFEGDKTELRHCFNICTLNAKDLPEEPLPGFADHIACLAKEFKTLASFLHQAIAFALDLPQYFFSEKHCHMLSGGNDNVTTLRLLYYPPIIEDDNKCEVIKGQCKYTYQQCSPRDPSFKPEEDFIFKNLRMKNDLSISQTPELLNNSIRCGEHTDYGTFTLLTQESEGGLEVKLRNSEKWQRVGHLPGAILINCGEILSIWTDGKYSALKHRVIIPEEEHVRARGRHSMALFCHPDNLIMISPAELTKQVTSESCNNKNARKKSFKTAKDKVYNAYQLVQRRFKETYGS